MAEKSKSIFQRVASDNWPGAEVYGDGMYGVVNDCLQVRRVFLFATPLEAQVNQINFCDAHVCWKKHRAGTLERLVPSPRKCRGENIRRMMESEA